MDDVHNRILKYRLIERKLDSSGILSEQLASTCKYRNELSICIECGEMLHWVRNCYLLKKDSAK